MSTDDSFTATALAIADEIIATRGTHPFGLSDRELEVLRLVCDGGSDKSIGRLLGVNHNTVHSHRRSIRRKTGVRGGAKLGVWALRNGLVA